MLHPPNNLPQVVQQTHVGPQGPPPAFWDKVTPELLGQELDLKKTAVEKNFELAKTELGNQHELRLAHLRNDTHDRRLLWVLVGVAVVAVFAVYIAGDLESAKELLKGLMVFLGGWGAGRVTAKKKADGAEAE